mmetsp:Transcript_21025/g.37980  ORF Transcript_21025/g.37980 Transcript_21025/m.37980 type:complete len:275 (-) Transcript_21025:230-1054(-)
MVTMADPTEIETVAQEQESSNDVKEEYPPNATLYVSNLDWSIRKNKLKRALQTLFTRHGKILEVVTLRKEGLRGQAWIIFESVDSATATLQAEQGFSFFGKPLKISFAKEKSDRLAKREGSFDPNVRRAQREAAAAAKKQKLANGLAAIPAAAAAAPESIKMEDHETVALPPSEVAATAVIPAAPAAAAVAAPAESIPPSNILFAQDLPSECNEMMLAMLFRQYAGYKEVRIPRAGLAFVEFDDEPHATLALKGLDGFKLTTTDRLNIKYGAGK